MKIFESFKDKTDTEKMYQIMLDDNPLNKKTKRNAINFLYNKVLKGLHTGLYSDEYWQGKQDVFKAFEKFKVPFELIAAYYSPEFPNEWKRWDFKISFINNRLREDTLYGYIKASGAGTEEDPLKKYDITVIIN